MDRRIFLRGLAGLGCSVSAHPFLTTVTMAEATADSGSPLGEGRLVVVILRGAMDGLDVVRPVADPAFAALRPTLAAGAPALPLGDRFGLHPMLADLMPLWSAGELGFAHAVSTPYRDKRSHFDGQDLLEAGTGTDVTLRAGRDGWMNRMLQVVPGLKAETAFAVGREALPLLQGAAPSMSWTPDARLPLSAQSRLLLEHLWHDDPLFREAGGEAVALAAEASQEREAERAALLAGEGEDGDAMMMMAPQPAGLPRVKGFAQVDALVEFAARRLNGATRIVAFSQAGWDTHRNQGGAIGAPLLQLQRSIVQMKANLGPEIWGKTVMLAMTEFGRTVAENGTKGTDHGTGGVLVMAGGALKGGRVMGRWPGLAEADLYDRRDLMPTSDVRAWAAWTMRALYGFDRGVLERAVFPGLDMGDDPGHMA